MFVTIRDDILMTAGFDSIADGLRKCGISGVELAAERDYTCRPILAADHLSRIHLDRDDEVNLLKEQMESANTQISALLAPNNFNSSNIDAELAWVIRIVEVAALVGARAVRIDAIMENADSMPRQQREDIFHKCVTHILKNTEGLNVNLGIENHGSQGNDPKFLEGLIQRVNSPRLGITMDIGNLYWAGYPLDELYRILNELAPYTKHTHVKNIDYPANIRNTRRQIGYAYEKYVSPIPDGNVDIPKVVGYLKKAGYQHDLCIEDESIGKYDADGRRANFMRASEYLREIIQNS
jgi:sugar phosphate isomerase/epimerase